MTRRRTGGILLIDVVCGLAMLTILTGAFHAASTAQFGFVADSLRETAALRIASSRLETVFDLAPGTREVPLDDDEREALPGGRVTRVVSVRERGLLEVTVRVRWSRGRSVELTSLRAEAVR